MCPEKDKMARKNERNHFGPKRKETAEKESDIHAKSAVIGYEASPWNGAVSEGKRTGRMPVLSFSRGRTS